MGAFTGWTWQMWVGKFLLLAVAIVEQVLSGLGIAPWGWWAPLATFMAWAAQWFISSTGPVVKWEWKKFVGKFLLLAVAVVEAVLTGLGIVPWSWWATAATFAAWVAQFLIGLV